MKKFKSINNDKLKEEFIKYFGEEKWNEENYLSNLFPMELALADYLGVEPIPVIIEDIEEDSRYYPKENYIVISKKLISDEVEALKCLTHEYKHYQQFMCIIRNVTKVPLLEKWKEDFQTNYANITSNEEMLALTVEVDAFAFTKYIMKEWFDIDVIFPNLDYDLVLEMYIEKYFR